MRLCEARGGFAAILNKGDPDSGALWLILREKGQVSGVYNQAQDGLGRLAWNAARPQDIENHEALDLYIQKQRRIDPDLWLIELDIPDAAQFTAESLAFD